MLVGIPPILRGHPRFSRMVSDLSPEAFTRHAYLTMLQREPEASITDDLSDNIHRAKWLFKVARSDEFAIIHGDVDPDAFETMLKVLGYRPVPARMVDILRGTYLSFNDLLADEKHLCRIISDNTGAHSTSWDISIDSMVDHIERTSIRLESFEATMSALQTSVRDLAWHVSGLRALPGAKAPAESSSTDIQDVFQILQLILNELRTR